MHDRLGPPRRAARAVLALGFVIATGVAPAAAQNLCGGTDYPFPYTDVAAVGAAFCPGIMEAYVTGVSKGTSPSTFSPNATVTRVQMSTFLQRSLDQAQKRDSRRAALNQWWGPNPSQVIAVPGSVFGCAGDGEHIWVSTQSGEVVVGIQASTGAIVGTWTGATESGGIVAAGGKVYADGFAGPGNLYMFDPTLPPSAVTLAAGNLGAGPEGLAFDGKRLWTANLSGSVSIITPQASTPYPVVTVGGFTELAGILYDGANIWVTDYGAAKLFKLDASGAIVQTVSVGANPTLPVFDGENIWVPNQTDSSITVVQAATGAVVATIPADANNLLVAPGVATFDGERVLVTNQGGNSVSVFKAADLSFIANVTTAPSGTPFGACSDGINFWVGTVGNLLRF